MAEHLKNFLIFAIVKRLAILNISKSFLKIDFKDRIRVNFNFEGINRAY